MRIRIEFKIVVLVFLLATKASCAPSHNVIECKILNESGEIIRIFPGQICVFFPDGSLVSSRETQLAFYGPDMVKKWEKPYVAHHQINLGNDGKSLLVLSHAVHKYKGKNIAFDKLLVLDLKGNLLKSFDFYDHREEVDALGREDRRGTFGIFQGSPLQKVYKNLDLEFSHANSFYEISKNEAEEKNSAFKQGNYLVNINGSHDIILVLNRKLDKILWSSNSLIRSWGFHDVQMQPNGWLLIYDNMGSYSGEQQKYTTIFELNPLTGERRLIFRADPPESMYSTFSGGVQRLENGSLLISDHTNGGLALEIDTAGKRIWSIPNPSNDPATGRPAIFQQVKRYDLSGFLKNNKNL